MKTRRGFVFRVFIILFFSFSSYTIPILQKQIAVMKRMYLLLAIIFAISSYTYSQTAIKTSFETTDGYTVAAIAGVNNWSGDGVITTDAGYVKTGSQALRLSSAASSVRLDHTAYAKDATGLTDDVYLDIWIKAAALNGQFTISTYDLTPNSSAKRAFEVILTSGHKIKIYSKGTGSEDASFTIGEWFRISAKIDYAAGTYQVAVNGTLIDKTYNFREDYTPETLGRPSGNKEYHNIRFSNGNATNDIAFEDFYIGTEPIDDVTFGSPNYTRTVTVTQPSNGVITLSPQKEFYNLNEEVSASIAVADHYKFTGWTCDLSGTASPNTFTVTKNMTIGATVEIDNNNPPPTYTITVQQPQEGGSIALEPQQDTYYEGTSVKAIVSLNIGYDFKGWTNDLDGTDNPQTFAITKDMTIGATIEEKTEVGEVIRVNTASALKTALADMVPGDEIVVADGDYNIGGVALKNLGGTNSKPVIVRAENIGKAKLTNKSYFTLTGCENIIFQGFIFDLEHVSTIFKLEGSSYIRITQNEFRMSSTESQSSKWIILGEIWKNEICRSKYNRIDHNLFDGKMDGGAWVVIDGSHGTVPEISKYDKIDHNHFRNNKPRVTNEKETIRMGVSDLSMKSAYTIVEYNLFEECDGDPEVVSVKSCDNIVRYNTFLRSLGTLSLRHGFRNTAEGNYFFGDGKTDENGNGCGGVRVYGLDHVIINNYFEGLTGKKWDAAITITNGDVANSSSSTTSHNIPENVVFAFNTLVNNVSDIEIGFDNNGNYGKAPKNCLIANNIIVNDTEQMILSYSNAALNGVKFENNIMYPTGTSSIGITYTESQIKVVDPMLVKTNMRTPDNTRYSVPYETYKISSGSPAINASTGAYTYLLLDSEGQARQGVADIGADEYNTTDKVTTGVLGADQVGIHGTLTNYETSNTTGVGGESISEIIIYPNPVTDVLNIKSDKDIHEVEIFSLTGRSVLKTTYSSVDLSNFQTGIYLIEITYSDGNKTKSKFLKK